MVTLGTVRLDATALGFTLVVALGTGILLGFGAGSGRGAPWYGDCRPEQLSAAFRRLQRNLNVTRSGPSNVGEF